MKNTDYLCYKADFEAWFKKMYPEHRSESIYTKDDLDKAYRAGLSLIQVLKDDLKYQLDEAEVIKKRLVDKVENFKKQFAAEHNRNVMLSREIKFLRDFQENLRKQNSDAPLSDK